MELIDRNKIEFSPIEIYNFDEHKHEVNGMALFKDIEKIPTVKAIPLEQIEQAKEEIDELDGEFLNFYDGANRLGSGKYICAEEVSAILEKLIKNEG